MLRCYLFVILGITYLFTIVSSYRPRHPIAHLKYGDVVGTVEQSRYKREYLSFKGIPYAKPPIGDLRFKAPEPPEPWPFSINGTVDAPYCIQINYFFANPKVEGNEDCLYLNIYVPITENPELLPVMVFIHWGGFFAGRGSSDYLNPEYMMDKDVILVTLNYRLGVFGFFSTLDDNAPGNYGLKDQVMALKFVQETIECFGGDKNRVTIFGQSAGGGSVDLHLISPLSAGLFQQAISESGTALNLWAKPFNVLQPNVTAALAVFVGCSEHLGNNSKLVKCLRDLDPAVLAESSDKFKYFSIEPLTPYTLVTETKTANNPNPFLTKEPLEYLQAGEFQKVPYIIGVVQNEGILRASALLRQPETLKTLNANFSSLLPNMLNLQFSGGLNASDLYNDIVNFYLNGKPLVDISNPKSIQGFINLYSDKAFIYGTYQTVILQSKKSHKPIWMYNFDYRGQFTYGDLFAATPKNINFDWGTSHCDDLLYLFKSPALFPDLQDETDLFMSENMLTLWSNFAIFGQPDPVQNFGWKSLEFQGLEDVTNANLQFLNITGSLEDKKVTFKIQNEFLPERMEFWLKHKLAENFPELQ